MACTYDITTVRGKVRLIMSDTSTTACVFSDLEIDTFLDMHADNINLAAAEALEAWAAKYALSPDSEKIGDYAYTQKIIDKMLALAKRLRDKDSGIPVQEISSMDLTFGSGITAEGD